jgi:hypothetical protein
MPHPPSTRLEIFIGRSLAATVHPVAAWRSRSKALRLQSFAGYFVAGYLIALVALFLLAPTAIP